MEYTGELAAGPPARTLPADHHELNSHPEMPSEAKLELQGNITRCYGSLTTFNVLFSSKGSQFEGRGERD